MCPAQVATQVTRLKRLRFLQVLKTALSTECDRTTVGLLARRAVHAVGVTYVGKESHRVEDVEQGLVHSWDEVLGQYHDAESEWWDVLLPRLRAMPRARASAISGISERALSSLRSGRTNPSSWTVQILRGVL